MAWVVEHIDQIELFILPSYSPQFISEERLNGDLKQEMGTCAAVLNNCQITSTNDHMAMLEQNSERVMSNFQHRRVRYVD